MKKLMLAAACAVAFSSAATQAATIDFSYTFTDSTVISGSLSGDLLGGVVQNISNLQVALNGVAFNGPLLLGAWDAANGAFDTLVAPVISTTAALNNFVITDGSPPLGTNATNFFYMTSSPDFLAFPSPAVFGTLVDGTAAFDDLPNGSWQVQAVPLPAGLLLFSSGLGLLGALKRRRAAAS